MNKKKIDIMSDLPDVVHIEPQKIVMPLQETIANQEAKKVVLPPLFAYIFVLLFCAREDRDFKVGDLQETFQTLLERYQHQRFVHFFTCLWYWGETYKLFPPRVKRRIQWLMLGGGVIHFIKWFIGL